MLFRDSGFPRTQPEAQALFQELSPGHVVGAVAGKIQADHTIEDIERTRA